jgi:pimeloyl-ACP methyl ester carboxylesterase
MLPATAGAIDTIPAMERIWATAADLPAPVAAALANPEPPRIQATGAAGYQFSSRVWGSSAGSPLLLIHGVTGSSATWWRIGPALAATGRLIIAPDLPGHGLTGGWKGRHRFRETAADLREFCRALEIDHQELEVVGHSWGAMVSASLPAAGVIPRTIVLVDPPYLPREFFEGYVQDPEEQPYPTMAAATAAIRAANPMWSAGDVDAKAEALTEFDVEGARAVVLENTFDAGLAALAAPAASGIPVWYVLGEAASGSLIPEDRIRALQARVGDDHVLAIADGAHSPQRMHPEATLVAILRALDG